MNRKLGLGYVFLCLAVASILSCSSDKKPDDGVSPDVAEATSDAGAPNPDGSAQPADGNAPVADGATPAPADPNAPVDANAAPPPADPGKAPETAEGDMSAAGAPAPAPGDVTAPAAPGDVPPAPGGDQASAPPPADGGAVAPPSTDTASAAPTDSGASGQSGDLFGAGTSDSSTGAGAGSDAPAPARKKSSAVVHIKDAPFTRGGQNLNTVYIAREGDTLDSVSQKLFGEDRTKDLKKANPSVKKSMKTGDKVYFNSPNRPDDKEKMLTVYEDQGLEASHYTTKEGDTLKSLAQEWYGSETSWKEVYAVNKGLTSTKELPAGTELTYWPATAAVAVYGAKKEADVAANNAPPPGGNAALPPPPGGNVPPPPPDMNANMPPPPPGGNVPPPPGGQPGAMPGTIDNSAANMPPPPPPPDLNAGVPPPPAVMKKHPRDTASPLGGMDKDMIMYGAAAGVFLIGGALLVAIRRRSARRNSGITQV
jgi:phage tail protein X